ncbi:hypothetical protein L21SP5_00493 [Salinivirga cyanobacteriivorans]|uniref:Uncharacterized protein n=1 Tax=Salinivirga cyanobacteriivorans TaxID=1307839 RepID=A0A0S2HVU2_9BACT|nr:hypothetical protein [Salinivirga cyanobacteriivorans]ALO14169.1 hypothetical protein L21SP5_00493 [Salinivirga cyanobacteriivorans]
MLILKVFLVSIGLMAIVFAALGIKILVNKNGEFPNTHIGGNKEMIKRGIYCAQTWDKIEQKNARKGLLKKLKPDPDFLVSK